MKLHERISNNRELIDELVRKGAMPVEVVVRYQMYSEFVLIYAGNRRKKGAAIKTVAAKFKCSGKTVCRAIQMMES